MKVWSQQNTMDDGSTTTTTTTTVAKAKLKLEYQKNLEKEDDELLSIAETANNLPDPAFAGYGTKLEMEERSNVLSFILDAPKNDDDNNKTRMTMCRQRKRTTTKRAKKWHISRRKDGRKKNKPLLDDLCTRNDDDDDDYNEQETQVWNFQDSTLRHVPMFL